MIQEGVRADGDDDEPRIAFVSKGVIVNLVENIKLIDNDEVRYLLVGH